jgi:hypothetical protein
LEKLKRFMPALHLFGLAAVEQQDRHDQDRQHHHRQGGRHRPVTVVEELLPQHFADHQGFRAAEQFRDHELAHHRDEHQHAAGDDAVLGQRHGDLPEAVEGARTQVRGGLQQALVVLHQVGVQRQDHERQVRIDHADIHRQVGVEDLQRLVDQPQPHQEAVEQAVVAEDAHPGVDADQDRGPGRHHDQQQQDGLRSFLALAMA